MHAVREKEFHSGQTCVQKCVVKCESIAGGKRKQREDTKAGSVKPHPEVGGSARPAVGGSACSICPCGLGGGSDVFGFVSETGSGSIEYLFGF